ncbi:hypothetical protein OS493_011624 [Desmophyllum pertusum]|uniref:Uncharacterized protein n=1 Tax=Desmophyllum pertusum TaxID=174260 RepID=A0A9X0CLS7_9CNID|nr:hypothetical protein OS493_011624 [Desmophyllum pertusum]
MGQKYGYRPFPAKIDASEFEKLLGAIDNQEDLQLMKHWFWRDDNSVPAQYLLQPITSLLPGYRDYASDESRKKASAEWWKAFERMQVVLRMAADKALDEESERHKYYMSGMTQIGQWLLAMQLFLSLSFIFLYEFTSEINHLGCWSITATVTVLLFFQHTYPCVVYCAGKNHRNAWSTV